MNRNSRKMWILGIVGCLLFGIGDWLLGYVDPGTVGADFFAIRTGHGENYNLFRVTLTILFGVIGMVFLIPGFQAQTDILKGENKKRVFRFLMTLCAISWLVIHVTVSVGIYVYSWCMHMGNEVLAHDLTKDVMGLFRPIQLVCYGFLAVTLVMQIVDILTGKTICNKKAALFTPLIWMGIFSALAKIIPEGPFANGLDTFCMNAGMMVWLGYLCISNSENR